LEEIKKRKNLKISLKTKQKNNKGILKIYSIVVVDSISKATLQE